jgi:hypothetical protein
LAEELLLQPATPTLVSAMPPSRQTNPQLSMLRMANLRPRFTRAFL